MTEDGLETSRAADAPDRGRSDRANVDVTRRTSLAAERTFLAWWRTGIAGFVVALGAGGIIPDLVDDPGPRWPYVVLGCGFAVMGGIAVVYGTWRARAVGRAIERDEWLAPSAAVTLLVSGLLVVLGIGLIALLLFTGSA